MFDQAQSFKDLAKNYKRMDIDSLNDEGVLMLLENLHESINGEMRNLAENYALEPKNREVNLKIMAMTNFLRSRYYNIISLGNSENIVKKFQLMIEEEVSKKANKKIKVKESTKTGKKKVDICEDPEEVRERMKKYRQVNGISVKDMAKCIGISKELVSMVEAGEVTHPKIAKKIQKAYGLTDEETEFLIPRIHRKDDEMYEPDKYMIRPMPFVSFPIKED